jgi:hypothetical protein
MNAEVEAFTLAWTYFNIYIPTRYRHPIDRPGILLYMSTLWHGSRAEVQSNSPTSDFVPTVLVVACACNHGTVGDKPTVW